MIILLQDGNFVQVVDALRRKDGFGAVLFSHRMLKVNKGNSNSSRALLITDTLIYKLDPGKNSKYKAMGKGIPILNVSDKTDELSHLLGRLQDCINPCTPYTLNYYHFYYYYYYIIRKHPAKKTKCSGKFSK